MVDRQALVDYQTAFTLTSSGRFNKEISADTPY